MKKFLAICDDEKEYVTAFVDYMSRQRSIGFEYIGFTDLEKLNNFVLLNQVSILLIKNSFYKNDMDKWNCKIFFLNEIKDNEDEKNIYKYQSIQSIIKEISKKCDSQLVKSSGKNLLLENTKMLGIYSPIKRTGKSIFSITLSCILSKHENVIYINMENNCGFEWAYSKNNENDLSDLIYMIRQKEISENKLLSTIKNNGYFDFIPVVAAAEDLHHIEYLDIKTLLNLINQLNRYNVIVIEFDEMIADYMSLLSECNIVYMPVLDDDISITKLRHFLKILNSKAGYIEKEKFIPLALPICDEDFLTSDGLERLLWSNFASYVKEVICEVKI